MVQSCSLPACHTRQTDRLWSLYQGEATLGHWATAAHPYLRGVLPDPQWMTETTGGTES